MQAYITFHFAAELTEKISKGKSPAFSNLSMPFASAKLFTIAEGHIFRQSSSNYEVHIDLFECVLNEGCTVKFTIDKSGFFLFLMLEGNSLFIDNTNDFNSEAGLNTYYISYMTPGNYQRRIMKGAHKLIIFTLRPTWFITTYQHFPEFKQLIKNYLCSVESIFNLPRCPIDKSINTTPPKRPRLYKNRSEFDLAVYNFLYQTIVSYHKMLAESHFITEEHKSIKATEIRDFIEANFTSQIVENEDELAKLIGLSTRNLHRLVRFTFHQSLRKKIIELRMLYALKLLATTDKSINEVAALSGYTDPYYFSRAFKRYHGVLPSRATKNTI